jgi:hypothetical protein
VLGAIHAHALHGPRCCPSQELLALETGFTREWVNRDLPATARPRPDQLAEGQARKGVRWTHNVYRLEALDGTAAGALPVAARLHPSLPSKGPSSH